MADQSLNSLALELKKLNDDDKRSNIEALSKSKNKADRELADALKKELASDTSTMVQTGENSGRRIDKSGKATGAELPKKEGSYTEVKKAKGGTASARGDGCCQRGKTKGRMV
jgi:hypothetical protein